MPSPHAVAFAEALEALLTEKTALPHGAGAAATLAALGGVGNAYRTYSNARDEGKDFKDSLLEGGQGALVGAAGGAAAGGLLNHVAPSWGKTVSQFGQSQVHGLTGWKPREGLGHLDIGMEGHKARLADAIKGIEGAQSGLAAGHVDAAHAGALASNVHARDAAQGLVDNKALQKADKMGLTSLPGYVRAVQDHGPLEVLRTAAGETWHGNKGLWKIPMLALPAASLYEAASSSEAPDGQGAGKGERIGQAVGQVAGGVVGAGVPMVGQMVAGEALGSGGKHVGRIIDRLRGRHAPPSPGELPPHTDNSDTDLTRQSPGPYERMTTEQAKNVAGMLHELQRQLPNRHGRRAPDGRIVLNARADSERHGLGDELPVPVLRRRAHLSSGHDPAALLVVSLLLHDEPVDQRNGVQDVGVPGHRHHHRAQGPADQGALDRLLPGPSSVPPLPDRKRSRLPLLRQRADQPVVPAGEVPQVPELRADRRGAQDPATLGLQQLRVPPHVPGLPHDGVGHPEGHVPPQPTRRADDALEPRGRGDHVQRAHRRVHVLLLDPADDEERRVHRQEGHRRVDPADLHPGDARAEGHRLLTRQPLPPQAPHARRQGSWLGPAAPAASPQGHLLSADHEEGSGEHSARAHRAPADPLPAGWLRLERPVHPREPHRLARARRQGDRDVAAGPELHPDHAPAPGAADCGRRRQGAADDRRDSAVERPAARRHGRASRVHLRRHVVRWYERVDADARERVPRVHHAAEAAGALGDEGGQRLPRLARGAHPLQAVQDGR